MSYPSYAQSQSQSNAQINQYDDNGKKTGLWVSSIEERCKKFQYYKDGVQDGLYWQIGFYGLLYLGEYKNGKCVYYYIFSETGHISLKFYDFKVNTVEVDLFGNGTLYKYPYSCQMIDYHHNGQVREKGILLFDDFPEMDTSRYYGEWNYYDENGNLIKTKHFK